MTPAKHNSWYAWGVMLLALLLRVPHLNGSFWLDEAAQALEIVRPLSAQLHIVEDFQPPLLHLILHAAQYASHDEWFLRLVGALIPGLITVFATYQIGKKWHSPLVGLIAALLLATSSFHIFYSQELRPYALPTMIAALSWWRVLTWNEKKRGFFDAPYCLLSFLGVFSTYLYPFLILAQVLFVMLSMPHAGKRLTASLALAGIGFLPWLPFFIGQFRQGSIVQASLPGWASIVGIPQLKSLPLVASKFLFGVVNIEPSAPFLLGGLLFLIAIAITMRLLKSEQWRKMQPMLIWLTVPIALAWLVSFAVPILQPKRVLFTLPAFYLLIGFLIDFASAHKQRAQAGLLLAVVLGINICATTAYWLDARLQREDWRSLHAQIVREYPADTSVVLFSFPEPFAPWRWYDDGTYPVLSTGQFRLQTEAEAAAFVRPVMDGRFTYVLVFDYLRDLTDPDNLIPAQLQALGFEERGVLDYPNIGFVRVFARSGAVTAYAHWN